MLTKRSVYLDHSATTPTDPRVVDAMLPYLTADYGNSASAHAFGRKAEDAVETSRETIARILNCDPHEIIFTSGGSERSWLSHPSKRPGNMSTNILHFRSLPALPGFLGHRRPSLAPTKDTIAPSSAPGSRLNGHLLFQRMSTTTGS